MICAHLDDLFAYTDEGKDAVDVILVLNRFSVGKIEEG